MSSGDLIAKKKYNAMAHTFSTKDSSNKTLTTQINHIYKTKNVDVYGQPLPNNWFGIPIPRKEITACPCASIDSKIKTSPLITKPPEMSIEPAIKNQLPWNLCSSCVDEHRIYLGIGPLIPGFHKYVLCEACGNQYSSCSST
jgi:hypothetical protein